MDDPPANVRRCSRSALLLLAAMACGCAPALLPLRTASYELDARIDPGDHTLSATVSVELEPLEGADLARKKGAVELRLHPSLLVESVEIDGADLRAHRPRAGEASPEASETAVVPTIHRLVLADANGPLTVRIDYRGSLYQDVGAGEKPGEIHNFAVSAHVGAEGIYLAPEGYWYPRLAFPAGAAPASKLADYRLAVQPVEGIELVAGLEREPGDAAAGAAEPLRWSSPFPLDGLVLLGGPLERASRDHGDIRLHAVLAPGKQQVAEDILDASAEYLDAYQALIGPYPFSEFTVLEAFFSSGFAFPTCTQIAGSQLSEYKQYRRHGYLDHELLHNWWGNGILVDPRDGNWCEGLASYMGNYYGFVLDGDDEGARKQRRNQSNFLSAIDPDADKPLGTFGLDDGAGRGIGYQKAASVFHMLERRIGSAALFAGLRRLTSERLGRYTHWEHLREAFEKESGTDLATFFEQWVRRAGAPQLTLERAEWRPGADVVQVTIAQGDTDFELDVPLRLFYGDGSRADVVVQLRGATDTVEVPCRRDGLTAIELDPDYHLFRKLKPEEVMPTSLLLQRGPDLVIVVPDGELTEGYAVARDTFRDEVLGDEDDPEEGHSVTVLAAAELSPEELGRGHVLVLGEAVRHPTVQALLARTRSPVSWTAAGFAVEGEIHDGAGEALLMTVHHPDRPGSGVTVYYGNSPAALANARVLTFYANSLLVFESPADGPPGTVPESGMPPTRVIRRMDFEFHERIEF